MLCLPKSIADKLKTSIQNGDVPLDKLYDMTDTERRTVFAHSVGEESAKLVNSEFEKGMVEADKKAKADYVTASEKSKFAKTVATGEFAKKLLTDDQAKQVAVDKINKQIEAVKSQRDKVQVKMENAEGEDKTNLELKINKLQDKEAKLNIKLEDTKNPPTDRMLKKINSMKNLLSPEEDKAMMADLASTKMGQDVTPAQGKYIVDQASKLQELSKAGKDTVQGVTPDYINTRNNLENYINNLNPKSTGISILKNLIEIARNNLITNVATPLKTFISGGTSQMIDMAVRRISSLSLRGDNPDLANQIEKSNADFRAKTGVEPSTLMDLNDSGSVMGSHYKGTDQTNEKFDPVNQSGGNTSKILEKIDKGVSTAAAVSHNVAINLEHNILFNKIYNSAFADTLNFRASDIAKAEGLKGDNVKSRAAEIMTDAAKIEPTTDAGKLLRNIAQEQASRVLGINNTWASRLSVGIKNALNNINPDIPIGNLIEPIAKIPANIIANGLNTTPLAIPESLWDIVKGKINLQSDDGDTKYQGMQQYKNGVEQLIRIVGSVGVAALITSKLTAKDFKSDQYGDHFVLFGNTWINTEYFNLMSPNIAGFMAMKTNAGKGGIKGDLTALTKTELSGLLNLPGVNNVNDTFQSLVGKTTISDLKSSLETRAVPAGILDMFKDRPINRIFFGSNGAESVQNVKADNEAKAKKAAATRRADKKP